MPASSIDEYRATYPWNEFGTIVPIKDEDDDDLQRFLDSLVDSEDEMGGGVYRREFLNDCWQSLYVPFAMNYSDWAGQFEVASISDFKYYDDNGDGYIDCQELEASIVESGSLQANYPYLIRAKDRMGATLEVSVPSTYSQRITVASIEYPNVTYKFTGNYSRLTGLNSARRYRLQGGALSVPTNDSEVLPPYRWYLTINSTTANEVRVNIVDGNATGVNRLKCDDADAGREVYDLSGRRLDVSSEATLKSLTKGVYIINGKKCVIR